VFSALAPSAFFDAYADLHVSKSTRLLLFSAAALLAGLVAYREAVAPLLTAGSTTQRHDHAAEKTAKKDAHGHDHGERREGFVKLTAAQVRAAGIETAPVTGGKLIKEIAVPGRVSINADRQAKIVPRLSGAVVKITKRLGEAVAENEVLAVLESREMADGKAEFLAARRAGEIGPRPSPTAMERQGRRGEGARSLPQRASARADQTRPRSPAPAHHGPQ
jgi:multidrug efflux pump subunit AcrA (membrane-fusion protein)